MAETDIGVVVVDDEVNSDKIHSYSSPYNIGHKALERFEGRPGLLEEDVFVEEKVDGSQFSFTKDYDGIVKFRSRKTIIYPESPGMFKLGIDNITNIAHKLAAGFTYRGEYLSKPKHNCLAYDRVPKFNVIIYDIETSPNDFMHWKAREEEAKSIGFEVVPVLFVGRVISLDFLKNLLATPSILGGPIEGIVIKPKDHMLWGRDKKVLMGKFVREDFKEQHEKNWKKTNPGRKDVIKEIIDTYKTPQRWNKAIQHLKEAGELEGSPRDIGKLFKEIPKDIRSECEGEIRDVLFSAFWQDISRGITAGLAEWYKDKLANDAFDNPEGKVWTEKK